MEEINNKKPQLLCGNKLTICKTFIVPSLPSEIYYVRLVVMNQFNLSTIILSDYIGLFKIYDVCINYICMCVGVFQIHCRIYFRLTSSQLTFYFIFLFETIEFLKKK